MLYEVFSHSDDSASQAHLPVRFKKYSHDLIVKEKKQARGTRALILPSHRRLSNEHIHAARLGLMSH